MSTTPERTAAEILTAFHEAGHAVMALSLGRDVHKVSILPNSLHQGICELKKGRVKPAKDWLETEVLILLAGLAAEAKFSGQYAWQGARQDLRMARSLVHSRAGTEKQAEKLERRMLDKAEYLLEDDTTWLAVTKIAKELLTHQTISGRAARHHYELVVAQSEA